jgi:hypothetical protein
MYLYPVVQLTYDEFLDRYRGPKRAVYERARENLIVMGFNRRKHTLVKAFLKNERQLKGKAPRLIRPFSPEFNLCFGTFIYPLEKDVYSGIDSLYGCPTVTKGMNSLEVAAAMRHKWDMFDDPVCVVTDMSRFDQHCSAPCLRWAGRVCTRAVRNGGGDTKLFRSLWDMTVATKGIVLCDDGVIHYKVDGTLNSGLSSTSLVGVLTVCLLLREFCLENDIPHQLISAGDDTNIICDRSHIDTIVNGLPGFAKLAGFTIKIDGLAFEFEHIDFCQSRPVWGPGHWVMCRSPRVVTSKDLLSSKGFQNEMHWRRYLRSIGECGLALTSGLPVMQNFYQCMVRVAGEVPILELERNGFHFMSRGMSVNVVQASSTSRLSFYKAFGIDVVQQRNLEEMYDGVVGSWLPLGRDNLVEFTPNYTRFQDAFQEEQ